jgi:hypothetical protein
MKSHRRYITRTVFFLVTGYFRATPDQPIGRVVQTQACTHTQLNGVISRMLSKGGANVCVVEEISEETFSAFYQEGRGRANGYK